METSTTIVIWFQEDGEDKYYGYLTNDEESPEEETVTIYAKRWRIENFLKEAIFLNIDKMPGIELNKISAMLAIKLIGYCTVSCLRRDIGGDYAKVEIERMFEKFLNIQAFVGSQGDKIHVTYYRYPSELVPLFRDVNEKLKNKGISPATFILNKIHELDTSKHILYSYNQTGTNRAIFSILTGLIPLHFDDPLPFNMFTIADINRINSADFNTRFIFGSVTLVTPRSTILTTRFCLFEVSTI